MKISNNLVIDDELCVSSIKENYDDFLQLLVRTKKILDEYEKKNSKDEIWLKRYNNYAMLVWVAVFQSNLMTDWETIREAVGKVDWIAISKNTSDEKEKDIFKRMDEILKNGIGERKV